MFFGKNDAKAETPVSATSCKELTHWKRLWCWEGLRAGGEGDNRGWDGWMASPTQCAWVWVNSGSWWWTGRPGVLPFMGLQRVGHDWTTELNWIESFTHKRLKNVACRKQPTFNFDYNKSVFYCKMHSSDQKNLKKKKIGYKPGLSICLLYRDSADTMICVCFKFVKELSWQLYFYVLLILWYQEQDCEESSLVRNRITRE